MMALIILPYRYSSPFHEYLTCFSTLIQVYGQFISPITLRQEIVQIGIVVIVAEFPNRQRVSTTKLPRRSYRRDVVLCQGPTLDLPLKWGTSSKAVESLQSKIADYGMKAVLSQR